MPAKVKMGGLIVFWCALGALSVFVAAVSPAFSRPAGLGAPTAIGGKYYGTIIRFTPPAPIAGETLANYNVYRAEGPICSGLELAAKVKNKNPSTVVWYDFTAFDANAVYWYTISAVDTNGVEGPQSTCIKVQIPAGD